MHEAWMTAATHKPAKIRVGVSSCLLGQEVRFNGTHKHMSLLTQDLARYFEFVPTCP